MTDLQFVNGRRLWARLDVLVKQRNNLTGGEPDEHTN